MSASRRALVGGGLLFAALLLAGAVPRIRRKQALEDRKSTRLNSSHGYISYAVFCLKKKKTNYNRVCVMWLRANDRLTASSSLGHPESPVSPSLRYPSLTYPLATICTAVHLPTRHAV